MKIDTTLTSFYMKNGHCFSVQLTFVLFCMRAFLAPKGVYILQSHSLTDCMNLGKLRSFDNIRLEIKYIFNNVDAHNLKKNTF